PADRDTDLLDTTAEIDPGPRESEEPVGRSVVLLAAALEAREAMPILEHTEDPILVPGAPCPARVLTEHVDLDLLVIALGLGIDVRGAPQRAEPDLLRSGAFDR